MTYPVATILMTIPKLSRKFTTKIETTFVNIRICAAAAKRVRLPFLR